MFATLVLILPSLFSGASVHLSHAGMSAVMDCNAGSLLKTTALAWYTDVTHEVKPTTSGYRLALAYNLVHTANALRPSLPSSHSVVTKLRHVLLSWKQSREAVPLKIIHLLDHKYSQVNLKGSSLKGKDAHKVAVLELLARELGFRVALANLELSLLGTGNDYPDDSSRGGMAEVEEREVSITNVVDLDGGLIRKTLDCEPEDDDEDLEEGEMGMEETIPKDLYEVVERGTPDAEEYEGYQGNVSCHPLRFVARLVSLSLPPGSWVRVAMYVCWASDRSSPNLSPNRVQAINSPHMAQLSQCGDSARHGWGL